MKIILLFVVLLLASTICNAQVQLDSKSLTNLIAISELYSQNPNLSSDNFVKSINSFRTAKLSQVIDTLIAVSKGDETILETRFLKQPTDEELVLWYVIREIHYNRTGDTKNPQSSADVAKNVLSKKIDNRWLLDNYYYRIHGGIASLFNTADLSQHNFKIDDLGFKDTTEKAIFFLNMMDTLVGGRLKVLAMMKNNKKILEFCDKLPKFNGKDYYYFKSFDYPDFDWIGYEKIESYNTRHIGNFYTTLTGHRLATAALRGETTGKHIFLNSILSQPKYFKFSELSDYLQTNYDSSK